MMDANFWLQKWNKNELGFHEPQANALLVKHFNNLSLVKGSRVFLPLCGKTHDIAWLLSNGYRIAGAELSKLAIDQLFIELGIEPNISKIGELQHYRSKDIDLFVGDIFSLSKQMLGSVDAIYDRAALVALPKNIRNRYVDHLTAITNKSLQLLITFEYDQTLMQGPPFSISNEEVKQLYHDDYDITFLEGTDVVGGLKGICKAKENIWLLKNV